MSNPALKSIDHQSTTYLPTDPSRPPVPHLDPIRESKLLRLILPTHPLTHSLIHCSQKSLEHLPFYILGVPTPSPGTQSPGGGSLDIRHRTLEIPFCEWERSSVSSISH